jgi:hypothetical protein
VGDFFKLVAEQQINRFDHAEVEKPFKEGKQSNNKIG